MLKMESKMTITSLSLMPLAIKVDTEPLKHFGVPLGEDTEGSEVISLGFWACYPFFSQMRRS